MKQNFVVLNCQSDLYRKINSCGILIKQIHDELEKQTNNALRSSDLTMAQMSALLILRQKAECQMSLKELERTLRVAQSTAAGIVSRLEQKGFVEAFGDPEDKRIKMVRMTEAGEQCCGEADKSREQIEKRLLSGLTESEREILLTLLTKVRNLFP